ncbi:MAG: hypothetical protein H0U59_13115 [Gemmatimonadaceae bacterium]|nr:hypothetical protein [Gemmatimonadaceae bacterium]
MIPLNQLPLGTLFRVCVREGEKPKDSVFKRGEELKGVTVCEWVSSSWIPDAVGKPCYFETDIMVAPNDQPDSFLPAKQTRPAPLAPPPGTRPGRHSADD